MLDHCLENYELVSIQVLPDDSGRKGKTAGDIRDLEAALKLCTQLEVDVVNLSAVSSLLSDSKYLYDAAKRLSQKAVIVSALDNDRYVTVPASYPFVVGVQSDREAQKFLLFLYTERKNVRSSKEHVRRQINFSNAIKSRRQAYLA